MALAVSWLPPQKPDEAGAGRGGGVADHADGNSIGGFALVAYPAQSGGRHIHHKLRRQSVPERSRGRHGGHYHKHDVVHPDNL
jgi:hypothetical protein